MTYTDVMNAAKAIIEYAGTDARMNALEETVKARVLTAHTWERYMQTANITYPANTELLSLDTNEYRKIYRIVAIRRMSGTYEPPEYITPDEWNRQIATGNNTLSDAVSWTQIGRSFGLIGQIGTTLRVVYMRDPADVAWTEIAEDFMEFSAYTLARMVTPITAGNMAQYAGVRSAEEQSLSRLIKLEYRQPGRSYQVQEEQMRRIRYEQFDY